MDESETDSQSHIDQDMFILEAKENFGSKGAKEAQEVLGRVNSLFAGGELDEDAKDVFFQAIMSVYMDSKKTAREKYTPKKYRKHKDKEAKLSSTEYVFCVRFGGEANENGRAYH